MLLITLKKKIQIRYKILIKNLKNQRKLKQKTIRKTQLQIQIKQKHQRKKKQNQLLQLLNTNQTTIKTIKL